MDLVSSRQHERRRAVTALLLAGFCVLCGGRLHAQSRMTGRVFVQSNDGNVEPVADAQVSAEVERDRPSVVAWALTDSQGRFELTALPEGRVTVSVEAHGYYTTQAGGLRSASIARTCPADGLCPEADFEVARASVLEGWMADSYGDPLPGVQIQLVRRQPAGAAESASSWHGVERSAVSDDRGYFRMWDLRPGRYELKAEQSIYGPRTGSPAPAASQLIEISAGQTRLETHLELKQEQETYTIAGRISGWSEEWFPRAALVIQPLSGDSPYDHREQALIQSGEFIQSALPAGEYALGLVRYERRKRNESYLTTLVVDRDLTDLVLTPKGPTGVRGRVVFVDSPVANLNIFLRLDAPGGRLRERLEAGAPDYSYERTALVPGGWLVEGVTGDYFVLGGKTLMVREGEMTEVELRLSNQYGSIRGRIELGADQMAAHYTVGIRGDGIRRSVQTDDAGGFVFPRVVPGDYEIAAWDKPAVDVRGGSIWEETAGEVMPLVVEPGFEVEIDLTVAP